jgi:hypothetical protein
VFDGRNKRWTCHKIKVGLLVIVELVVVAIVAVGVVGGRRCVAMTRRRASLAIGTLCSIPNGLARSELLSGRRPSVGVSAELDGREKWSCTRS